MSKAIKEKGKITIITDLTILTANIHNKMKDWEQLDYLKTNNKDLQKNIEY